MKSFVSPESNPVAPRSKGQCSSVSVHSPLLVSTSVVPNQDQSCFGGRSAGRYFHCSSFLSCGFSGPESGSKRCLLQDDDHSWSCPHLFCMGYCCTRLGSDLEVAGSKKIVWTG